MNRWSVRGIVICAALAALAGAGVWSTASAQERPGPPPPPGGQERQERGEGRRRDGNRREGPSVEGAMNQLNRGMETLQGQIGDAAKAEASLRILGEMERAAVSAKLAGLPGDLAKKDGDARKKAFRENLIKLTRKLLDAEEAVAAGKMDDAKAALAEAGKIRDAAHTAVGVDEKSDN